MNFTYYIFALLILSQTIASISPHRAMILLNRYGYLEIPSLKDLNSPMFERSLIVDGKYSKAIKDFQAQFKLPVTGIISPDVEKLLTAKRCGNPDFNLGTNKFIVKFPSSNSKHALKRVKRYYVDDVRMRWLKTDLTWRISSYPTTGLSIAAVKAIFTKAFNMWGEVTNLNYRQAEDNANNADIIIEFRSGEHGDSIPFDGPNYILAHAFYPSGSKSPEYSRAGDAHFDDSEIWIDKQYGEQEGGRMLLSVAVHELGHSMGLGHSALDTAIMYPFYINPTPGEMKLDNDDIRGMQSIYGPAEQGKQLPPIPHVPSNGHKYTPAVVSTPTIKPGKLDMCNTTIDVVIIIREVEIYVFSGKNQWRIDFSKTVTSWISYELRDGPESLLYYWPVLPKYVDHIDGGIERKDQRIYIFRDSKFWLVEDNLRLYRLMPENGTELTALGLPRYLKKIDTIFRWGHNKALYIMAGYQYWKLDETVGDFGYVYPRYPRNINSVWKGLPLPIDVAFTDLHDQTYFIKDKFYYEFDNLEMSVVGGPKPLTLPWIGCKRSKYY